MKITHHPPVTFAWDENVHGNGSHGETNGFEYEWKYKLYIEAVDIPLE